MAGNFYGPGLPGWDKTYITLVEDSVPPGGIGTFEATGIAHKPGTYRDYWLALRKDPTNPEWMPDGIEWIEHGTNKTEDGPAGMYYEIIVNEICSSISTTFCDVPNDGSNNFYTDIEEMVKEREDYPITDGCYKSNDGKTWYCPEAVLTRGAMAKFIIRAIGQDPGNVYDGNPPDPNTFFTDVPLNHTFYKYIRRITDEELKTPAGEKIASGAKNGQFFYPDRPITRGEMAKLVVNAIYYIESRVDETLQPVASNCYGLDWPDTDQEFPDVPATHTFYKYIRCLHVLGKVDGYTGGTFQPDRYISRGETARFISGMIDLIPNLPQESNDIPNNTPNGASQFPTISQNSANNITTTSSPLWFKTDATDIDYIKFNIDEANIWYRLHTSDNGLNADVRIEVYDSTATTLLAASEGLGKEGGTSLLWKPSASGTYYARLTNINPFAREGTGLFFNIVHLIDPQLAEIFANYKVTAHAINQNNGNHWFGTKQGVVHYDTETKMTTIYNTLNSNILSDIINDIGIAPNHDVWIVTNQGASRFDGATWHNYTKADGLAHNHANSLAIPPSGIVWIATNNGLSKFDGIAWVTYTKSSGLPHNQFIALATSDDEILWGVTVNGIFGWFDGNVWKTIEGTPNGNIDTMVVIEGNVYLGTNKGLATYKDDLFTSIEPQVNINEVTGDQEGLLWAISENGQLNLQTLNSDNSVKVGIYDPENELWLVSIESLITNNTVYLPIVIKP